MFAALNEDTRTSSSVELERVNALYAEPRSGSDGCQWESYLACKLEVSKLERLAMSVSEREREERWEMT